MDDMEELDLTSEMVAEAMVRDDDLGRLVVSAFTFPLPPFPFKPKNQAGGAD
jgi:hypothetical protein